MSARRADVGFLFAISPPGARSHAQSADNNVEPPPVSGALASAFVTDKVNSNTDDIFQGGGSKDTLGIQQGRWLFTDSKPQPKDDITHAYAAAYTDPSNGHLILYAGLDRFDNSGDATAGFWFFKNEISQNPNVTTNGGHPFVGIHSDGDILLVSDFTVGGSVSTIKSSAGPAATPPAASSPSALATRAPATPSRSSTARPSPSRGPTRTRAARPSRRPANSSRKAST